MPDERIAALKQARVDLRAVHKAITPIDASIAMTIWKAVCDTEDRLARELLTRELADA